MRICLYCDYRLPVAKYGGTERVVWSLGTALHRAGHEVTLLARKGSKAPFCRVVELDPNKPLSAQIPDDVDIVHLQNGVPEDVRFAAENGKTAPYVVTIHGNMPGHSFPDEESREPGSFPVIDPNSIFVSENHARRHGASAFVYNGLEWDDYPRFEQGLKRKGLFFLGNAAWKVKNLKGAIKTARMAGERLDVLGGNRLNLKMGFRFTVNPDVHFHGMVNNEEKGRIANRSEGLVFPVKWHEPFGLAVVEALYFGAPVFATPYGSLPELVKPRTGILSADTSELAAAIHDFHANERLLHEYASDTFNADVMARKYVMYYERRLNGENLNVNHTPHLNFDIRWIR